MVNALEPGQLKINGPFHGVADSVRHPETYGVRGGAMSFFQKMYGIGKATSADRMVEAFEMEKKCVAEGVLLRS